MPRKKAAQHANIRPWMSARRDCEEGRFIQVGNSLLLSDAFQALNSSAQVLYLCLAMESGGKQRVRLSRGQAKKYGIAPATYSRGIKELIDAGFLVIADDIGRFESNTFLFCTAWKENPVSK